MITISIFLLSLKAKIREYFFAILFLAGIGLTHSATAQPSTDGVINITGVKENTPVTITSLSGQTAFGTKGENESIDIGHLVKGFYLVNVSDGKFTVRKKIMKGNLHFSVSLCLRGSKMHSTTETRRHGVLI